jgi:hypothetical protein
MIFRDKFDILLEKKLSGVAEQGYTIYMGNPGYKEVLLRKSISVLVARRFVKGKCVREQKTNKNILGES